jgi:hypothetical protein
MRLESHRQNKKTTTRQTKPDESVIEPKNTEQEPIGRKIGLSGENSIQEFFA